MSESNRVPYEVYTTVMSYDVSPFPVESSLHSFFLIQVERRSDSRWMVTHLDGRLFLDVAGVWSYRPTENEDEEDVAAWWEARLFTLDEAMDLARKHVGDLMVNGKTAADVKAELAELGGRQ